MAELEPWFLALIGGLGGLILILGIVITVLCIVWSRKDKRKEGRKKKAAAALHTSFGEIIAEQERQNPDAHKPRVTNSNWILQEPQNPQFSVEANGKRKISGQEPFIVGTSLPKFSQELDAAGPLSTSHHQLVSGASVQGSSNRSDALGEQRQKTPESEEKKIKLGLIPPRPIPRTRSDVTGIRPYQKHNRASSGDSRTTSELSRPSSAAGIHVAMTNGLDAHVNRKNNENNWVVMKDTELQMWQRSPSEGGRVNSGFTPYPLPKEDYDLNGARWYQNKEPEPLYESKVQLLKEKFASPKPGKDQMATPTVQKQSRDHFRHSYAGNDALPAQGHQGAKRRTVMNDHVPTIWQRIPEDPLELKDAKINRVRRLGVPILPD